ncbi:MAG TPA: class I SAM-dependent RNA methyltransferase [Gemmatimonadales bacterium]|nr:class I SAM-dependent RNA methyltransferase [Gemmatimonadales bacterium]
MSSPFECFAVAAPGLETVTAGEVKSLGVEDVAAELGGVTFRASMAGVQDANLRLRTAGRVLVRIARFRARTFPELERHADRVEWPAWLHPHVPPEFEVTSKKSKLYHQKGIAERLVQSVARVHGRAATAEEPPQLFVVRAIRDEFTVSVDASGELLHRRGYRLDTAKAPLRETLGAAMLLASGWTPDRPLLDPFCGSGTIPIEAALMARRIAPGLGRSFAFERWPGFDAAAWRALRARAESEIVARAPAAIVGSDRDAGAISASRENAERAGVAEDVTFREAPLSAVERVGERGYLVTNPPYGVRIGEEARLRDLYATLGRVASQRLVGWRLAMLSANPRLEGATDLAWAEAFRTMNGGIPVRLLTHGPV